MKRQIFVCTKHQTLTSHISTTMKQTGIWDLPFIMRGTPARWDGGDDDLDVVDDPMNWEKATEVWSGIATQIVNKYPGAPAVIDAENWRNSFDVSATQQSRMTAKMARLAEIMLNAQPGIKLGFHHADPLLAAMHLNTPYLSAKYNRALTREQADLAPLSSFHMPILYYVRDCSEFNKSMVYEFDMIRVRARSIKPIIALMCPQVWQPGPGVEPYAPMDKFRMDIRSCWNAGMQPAIWYGMMNENAPDKVEAYNQMLLSMANDKELTKDIANIAVQDQ